MGKLLIARAAIGLAAFMFAVAAFPGTGAAGIAHLAAAAMLLSIAFTRGVKKRELQQIIKEKRLWATGLILAATNALSASSVAYAELTTLAVIAQAATIWAVLMAPLHKDRVSRNDLIGLTISLTGIMLVIGFSLEGQTLGIALALAASLLSALWSHQLGVKGRGGAAYDPAAWVGLMMLIGGILLPILQPRWEVSTGTLLACAAAGIALGLANWITLGEMKTTPAARTMLLKPLSALISALLGILFLGDTVSLALIAGGLLVLVGVWVIGKGHRQELTR